MPFGTQQAFFSRVELVAPVDDLACIAVRRKMSRLFLFFLRTLWFASRALEQWCRRIVAQTALWHRLHTVCASSLRE